MKEKKPYRLGILVGRFQTLHTGHEDMIRQAAALCETVGIFVGSSQESGTSRNPFSYELRKEMLTAVFGDAVTVHPLPDAGLGNTAAWGDYVLRNVRERFGRLPDLIVSGREARRTSWFDGEEGGHAAELYVPKTVEISASELRGYLLSDDRESWARWVNPALLPLYPKLREAVLLAQGSDDTASV